ncbi:hypothetical protein CHH91_04590 [Virgibacillus sp. 7505]|uniref:hypothetical protein n=1 Tax=Virgibacillus sp. 7505 TaxID=2022548 RepID=UPI000BA75E09|nr:hypothetical protein [Virgibacillus sp. 7505]PAE17287.1 hypothetical protein CHH91_04590 [Virgibacillus sp. 7505]
MPKYEANAYLTQGGKMIAPGEKVELTEEQAIRLGHKLKNAPGKETEEGGNGEEKYTEASLKKLGAEGQKAIVEQAGGNLEEITNEEKRIAFILENQE